MRRFLAPLLMLGLSSCALFSPVKLLNATAGGNFHVSHDIAYAPGPRGGLDVYAPNGAKAAPVVVFFYGGSWQEGSKAIYRFVGAALAARGVVAIIPDYRVYPEVRFPVFLEDNARAVAWAKANAEKFGGDPDRLVLMGHSAGAYDVAMLALDPQYLAAVGLNPKRDISGFIGLAGPYDFLPLHDPVLEVIFGAPQGLPQTQPINFVTPGAPPAYLAGPYDFLPLHDPVLQVIFGAPQGLPQTQPINFVTPGAPPAYLAAGLRDKTVEPSNSMRLAAKLRAAGDPVQERYYPKLDHVMIIAATSQLLSFIAPVLPGCLAFITTVTAPKKLRSAA